MIAMEPLITNDHFLVSRLRRSSTSDEQKIFSRTGLMLPKHILLTGFIALIGQCLVSPWLYILMMRPKEIVGTLSDLAPFRSIEWWLLFVIIIGCYGVCLYILKRFLCLCLLPFYSEKIGISATELIYEKRLCSILTHQRTLEILTLHKMTVSYDEVFKKKYADIYPVSDEDYMNSYGKEYRVQFWQNNSPVVCIDTLFEEEVQMILDVVLPLSKKYFCSARVPNTKIQNPT